MNYVRMSGVLVAMGIAWACSDSASEGPKSCVTSTDCGRGLVCKGNKCVQIECEGTGDCPGSMDFCAPEGINPDQPDKKFCSPVMCKNDADCKEGEICDKKYRLCVPGERAVDVTETTADQVDVVEQEMEEPDAMVGPQAEDRCIPCTTDSDCFGSKCLPLGGGTFCFRSCETNDDCATGWMCFKSSSDQGKQCIPMAFKCEAACLLDGCPEGKVCDQETGDCVDPVPACGECKQDWDCDKGYRCYQDGKYCAPSCGKGEECPANSTCQTVNGQFAVNLCISSTAECCYGENCANQCPAEAPYPFNGKCVECISDEHCAEGFHCGEDNTCVSNACQAPTPFLYEGKCVECLNSSHCASKGQGWVCDLNTHECKNVGSVPEECSYCVDPYPACAEINGVWSCVQCTDDSYCPGGTCDLSLYACVGGNPGCTGCTADSDCVSTVGMALACDIATGCCYDTAGWCDSVEAMCNEGAGSECLGITDLLMGGGIPGMPGVPEGTALGVCTCSEPMGMDVLMCLFMGGCPSGGCFGDAICIDPSVIPGIGDTLQGVGGICLNVNSLLDSLLPQ